LLKVVWNCMGLDVIKVTVLAAPVAIRGYGCISKGLYMGGQTLYMIPSVT